jgi:alpha-beta hydrolase superfamily lysophospholipase
MLSDSDLDMSHANPSFKKPTRSVHLEEVTIPVDGCTLSGLIGRPGKRKRAGVQGIVLVHGFAAEKRENGLFEHIAAKLVVEGYTVLLYDWRGLGDSKGDFSSTSLETHEKDFRFVAKWFEDHERLTPASTCALGFSLGATLVGLSLKNGLSFGRLIFLSPAIRPALNMWPRYDTPEIKSEVSSKGYFLKNEVRVGQGMLDSLRTTDLGTTALDCHVPLLACHGTSDSRIPVSTTREAFECVAKSAVRFVEFKNASHSFQPKQQHWDRLADVIAKWLGTEKAMIRGKSRQVYPRELVSQRPQASPAKPALGVRSRSVAGTSSREDSVLH